MTATDLDIVEINEAFAAVVAKSQDDLGIDDDRVNPKGEGSPWVIPSAPRGTVSSFTLYTSSCAAVAAPPPSRCAEAGVRGTR